MVTVWSLRSAVRTADVDVEHVRQGNCYGRGGHQAAHRGDFPAYRPADDARVLRKDEDKPGPVTARLSNGAEPRVTRSRRLLVDTCASAASTPSRGWLVSSAAQSRNDDRKPCATAVIRCR